MPLVPPSKRGPYTIEEVAKHNTPSSLWVIMNRKVYDVTAFHKRHPGGAAVLLQMGGKDATAAAAAAHKSPLPANLMWEFCIGHVVRFKPAPSVVVQEVAPAASPASSLVPVSPVSVVSPAASAAAATVGGTSPPHASAGLMVPTNSNGALSSRSSEDLLDRSSKRAFTKYSVMTAHMGDSETSEEADNHSRSGSFEGDFKLEESSHNGAGDASMTEGKARFLNGMNGSQELPSDPEPTDRATIEAAALHAESDGAAGPSRGSQALLGEIHQLEEPPPDPSHVLPSRSLCAWPVCSSSIFVPNASDPNVSQTSL